jgi:hypothetical protein
VLPAAGPLTVQRLCLQLRRLRARHAAPLPPPTCRHSWIAAAHSRRGGSCIATSAAKVSPDSSAGVILLLLLLLRGL